MKRTVRRRLGVSRDIVDVADYISRDSVDAALRFFDAVDETLAGLAELPGKGKRREFEDLRLRDLRSCAVNGFPNHLVFYTYTDDELNVIAILHGARDLPRELEGRM